MKPKDQLFLNEKLKEEREHSDRSYASKLVERIVFAAMGVISLGFLAYVLKLVWPS